MFMTFSSWRQWFGNLHYSLKWFILLILFKPVFDNFYFLKDISPFLSPLYIIGVVSPLLALYAITKLEKPNYSRLDTYMGIFMALVLFSCLVLLVSDAFAIQGLELTFRFITPFYLYFFIRRLVRSKEDLHGVFQTFLYSSIYVMILFTYELLFAPLSMQLSRGLERLQGNYADVMNYAIYMCFGLVLVCYAYLEKPASVTVLKLNIMLITGFVFSFLILLNIHHTASYIVIAIIILLFIFYNIRANVGAGVLVMVGLLGVIYVVASGSFEEKIMPLIATDVKVYEGEKGNEALLHGRVGRWMSFLDFFNEKNSFVQLLGLPLGFDHPYTYISKGSHNDYIRTLMFNGYIGLMVYIVLLGNIFTRILKYNVPMHFLGLAFMSVLVLYSISTTPLLYTTLLYVFLPVVAVLALPQYIMDEKSAA